MRSLDARGALATIVATAVLVLAVGALFCTPERAASLLWPHHGAASALLAASIAALVAGLVCRYRAALATALRRRVQGPTRRRSALVAGAIALGLAVRIAWMLAWPAPLVSDGRSYVTLATRLARGESYVSESGGVADWPPGYPLFLTPHVLLLGSGRAAYLVANLELFVATALLAAWLARRALGDRAAPFAVLLLALWPNLVTLAAVASKELLLAALLPLAMDTHLLAIGRQRSRRAALLLVTGAVLGAAALTQPAMALLPFAFALHLAWATSGRRAALAGGALLVAGAALVAMPWVWRNERMLGAPILASTGGYVFYGANHDGADGTYDPHTAQPLRRATEVAESRRTFALGRAWIAAHPLRFGALALRKQVFFLGDDGDGVYHTLRLRGWSGPPYAAVKALASGYWMLLWAGVALAGMVHRARSMARPEPLLIALTLIYLAVIDAVFEAGGRHHVPLAAGLVVLALGAAAPRTPLDRPDAA